MMKIDFIPDWFRELSIQGGFEWWTNLYLAVLHEQTSPTRRTQQTSTDSTDSKKKNRQRESLGQFIASTEARRRCSNSSLVALTGQMWMSGDGTSTYDKSPGGKAFMHRVPMKRMIVLVEMASPVWANNACFFYSSSIPMLCISWIQRVSHCGECRNTRP